MADDGYVGGSTTGGKCGCALAAIVGVPLLAVSVLINALGDCAAGTSCRKGLDWLSIGVVLAVTAALGFGARALINRVLERSRPER